MACNCKELQAVPKLKHVYGNTGALTSHEVHAMVAAGLAPPPPDTQCQSQVAVDAGKWHVAQRLGNTIFYLGAALMDGISEGGSVLIHPPADRYYNTSTFCIHPAEGQAGPVVDAKPKMSTKHCYSACGCSGNRFFAFRDAIIKYDECALTTTNPVLELLWSLSVRGLHATNEHALTRTFVLLVMVCAAKKNKKKTGTCCHSCSLRQLFLPIQIRWSCT